MGVKPLNSIENGIGNQRYQLLTEELDNTIIIQGRRNSLLQFSFGLFAGHSGGLFHLVRAECIHALQFADEFPSPYTGGNEGEEWVMKKVGVSPPRGDPMQAAFP